MTDCNYLICPREVDIEGDCWCLKQKYMELAINACDSAIEDYDTYYDAESAIIAAFALPPEQKPTIGTGEKE